LSEEWPGYLDEACAGDASLRQRVESLLRAHCTTAGIIDRLAQVSDRNGGGISRDEGAGNAIGPYKLLERIGEGGMGEVWMAEQREPIQRRVALKIIKAGMDTHQVVARFEAERQALALMDHPNIAKVFDAGATESGRPYFVMELVKGTPITTDCDEHRLSVRERLELFLPVCQAIQHAHQKGIIHRDIKPSNILIAPYDGRPVPKIIDFGVAKAMGQRLTERTMYTGFGAVVGTLEYMSPEQAELNNQDIDTRSDIYTLGVLLYELLTGTTPLTHERITHAAFTEMLRVIREEEPPRPSTRLSDSKETLVSVAEQRHTEPATLTKQLRRDLDWIVMKSLVKDRTRRYQTTGDFVRDIEHFLHNEPVEARPPSLLDRLAKWSRRHRQAVWASAAVLGVVLVALIASSLLIADAYKREKTQRIAARKSENKALAGEKRAGQQEKIAVQQKAEAERQRDAAERALYVANMQVASRDWTTGQAQHMEAVLEGHIPKPGRPDYRGWEWYYLFSQCHGERFVLPWQSSFCWSPDGKFLATADLIGLVNIWDVITGERKASLQGCPVAIQCLAWSPDTKHLAAGTDRGTVVVWDVGSGKKVRSLAGSGAGVHAIAWSPDGARLASGEGEGVVEWDLERGGFHASYQEIGEATVRIWDWRTGKSLSLLAARAGPVYTLSWHLDGRRLMAWYARKCVLDSSRELKIWDTASGREILRLVNDPGSPEFSPDGSRLAWGSEPVHIMDLKTRQVVSSIRDKTTANGAWSPTGDRLASTSGSGAIKIWDPASGAELRSIPARIGGRIAWSPGGEYLAAQDAAVRVWDAAVGSKIVDMPGIAYAWVAFSPDGKRLLVARDGERLRIHDVQSGELLLHGPHRLNWLRRPNWSPDGKRFATSAHSDRTGWSVLICDARTGEVVLTLLPCERHPRSLAWSPDGSILAVGQGEWAGTPGARVILFSTNTGRQLAAYPDRSSDRWDWAALAWSPNGKRLAAAEERGLRIWDSALHLRLFDTTMPAAWCVDWSPDSSKLAAGSSRGSITIYDAASGSPLHVLRGHPYVEYLQWHPSMPRIASVGRDGMIRLWDSAAGDEVCTIETHSSWDRDLDWSPDGWRLATTGAEGSVRIWDASPADRFFKRHGDLRAKVLALVGGDWERQRTGAMQQELREALDLLQQLRALHPEERDLQRQIHYVEWFQATQLARAGQTDEAISLFQRLTAEAPDLPDYRLVLPGELFKAGRDAEAIAMLEAAVAGFPLRSEYHEELAFLYERRAIQLCRSGELSDAVAILHKLAHEFSERPGHRTQVVRRLTALLPPGGKAIEVFRRLVQEFPDAPEYREELTINLSALAEQGKHSRAEAKYREVLRLRHQEKYAEAEAEYQQVLRLLPDFASQIASPGITLLRQRKFAAAARFYAQTLAAEPKLPDDEAIENRYDGACAAALAGCGLGSDAAKLNDVERARLCRQALDWLRADLLAWGQRLEKHPDQARSLAQQKLLHWLEDPDFNGVRGTALAMLPEAERQAWQQLWDDIEQMLKRVNRQDTKDSQKKPAH
jgi:WD40 repeat protein/serine/threonine protein kinase